ncbi:MAG: hypothetical protein H8D71_02140 [Deltaproteobacteria bacterium]|nr:hypothetical protein [Deltaproteobacteria bacterium]
MKRVQLAFLISCLPSLAIAGAWSDYKQSFPLFPCPDGWTTCEIDGATIGPGLVEDADGNPLPSNMRFSFWTFDVMPSASPFAEVSDYDGEMGGRSLKADEDAPVADVEDEVIDDFGGGDFGGDAIPSLGDDRPRNLADKPAAVTGGYDRNERDPVPTVADSRPMDPDPVADVPEPTPPSSSRDAGSSGSGGYQPPSLDEIRAARAGRTPTPAAVEPARVEPPPRAEPPPRVELPPRVEPEKPTNDGSASIAPPPPPPPPPVVENCDDLRALETRAILGNLGVSGRKCLDSRIAVATKLTDKDKISRVLISDAKARGDQGDWERLMKRHLEKIDKSDPNMCLVFSIHLNKRGVSKATQVIRWADYALENKTKWSGANHTRNVYYLHQLKSQAASRLWQRAEKKFVKERNEKNEAKANKYRSWAKQFSRAWLDYAKASGKETSKALAACVSASGTTEFCPL